jgi:hypothetical protein
MNKTLNAKQTEAMLDLIYAALGSTDSLKPSEDEAYFTGWCIARMHSIIQPDDFLPSGDYMALPGTSVVEKYENWFAETAKLGHEPAPEAAVNGNGAASDEECVCPICELESLVEHMVNDHELPLDEAIESAVDTVFMYLGSKDDGEFEMAHDTLDYLARRGLGTLMAERAT